MNDYEILSALAKLEIDRHERVIFELMNARVTVSMMSTKATLRQEIADEIKWRRDKLIELKVRRKHFQDGIQRRKFVQSRKISPVTERWRAAG